MDTVRDPEMRLLLERVCGRRRIPEQCYAASIRNGEDLGVPVGECIQNSDQPMLGSVLESGEASGRTSVERFA